MRRKRKGGRVYGPYRRDAGRRWIVRIVSEAGDGIDHSFATEAEAKRAAAEFGAAVEEGEGVTVKASLADYEKFHLKVRENKPASVVSQQFRLTRFLGPVMDQQLRQLTPDRCQALYDSVSEDMAVDSHRNILKAAKGWARWCVKKGWMRSSPLEEIEGTGRRVRGKAQLRLDEARRWVDKALELAAAGKDWPIAVLCTLVLGMRASEVTGRVVRDLDDGGRLLWIPIAKTDAGRRRIAVPEFMQVLFARLVQGKQPEDWLFPGRRRETIRKWVQRLCRLAKVPVVSSHGMRGTHATIALEAGTAVAEVAKTLGHRDVRLTLGTYALPGSADIGRTARIDEFFRQNSAKTHGSVEVVTVEPPEVINDSRKFTDN